MNKFFDRLELLRMYSKFKIDVMAACLFKEFRAKSGNILACTILWPTLEIPTLEQFEDYVETKGWPVNSYRCIPIDYGTSSKKINR